VTALASKARSSPTPGTETAQLLLDWYNRERRDLPWRYGPGEVADPYRVWLSEIMLQQTTVKAVVPYFDKFVRRWPNVRALSRADLEEVLAAWAGLGYYSRARNLHACAKEIAKVHAGRFPTTEAELLELPGIGPYTAAAIASIAFGQPATPVDGNVERVVSRLFAVEAPLPASKPELRKLAASLTPTYRAGDFAQAMMDLGATICSPKSPSCLVCPVSSYCRGRALGIEASLPRKLEKSARPTRHATAFVALREDGHVLLRKRPEGGLLGGMLEVPSTEWASAGTADDEALRHTPLRADWWRVPGLVVHTFTHFRLECTVLRAVVPADATLNLWADPARCRWVQRHTLDVQALPSVMHKIVNHAFRGGGTERAA